MTTNFTFNANYSVPDGVPTGLRQRKNETEDMLQKRSIDINGLAAVSVTGQSEFRNHYEIVERDGLFYVINALNGTQCFDGYETRRSALSHAYYSYKRWAERTLRPSDLEPIKGKNLSCSCHPYEPCHRNILLEMANTGLLDTNRGWI